MHDMLTKLERRLQKESASEISVPVHHLRWFFKYVRLMEEVCAAKQNLTEKQRSLLNADGASQYGGRANAFYRAQERVRAITMELHAHCNEMPPEEVLLDLLGR